MQFWAEQRNAIKRRENSKKVLTSYNKSHFRYSLYIHYWINKSTPFVLYGRWVACISCRYVDKCYSSLLSWCAIWSILNAKSHVFQKRKKKFNWERVAVNHETAFYWKTSFRRENAFSCLYVGGGEMTSYFQTKRLLTVLFAWCSDVVLSTFSGPLLSNVRSCHLRFLTIFRDLCAYAYKYYTNCFPLEEEKEKGKPTRSSSLSLWDLFTGTFYIFSQQHQKVP